MKVLLNLLVLVGIAALAQAKACEDDVLCTYREDLCRDNVYYQKLCPKICGKCGKLYKMTYFDLRGRAEQIRWILEQGEANWEDIRIKLEDWPKIKPTTILGQLPFLEVENVTLGQSAAVAMYLARELNLVGSNELEAAEVHMVWQTVQEAFNDQVNIRFAPDNPTRIQRQNDYDNGRFPILTKFLENRLKDGQEWLVGNKLSAADIVTASLLDTQTGKAAEAVKNSPTLSALTKKVKELPRIKNWIAHRPYNDY